MRFRTRLIVAISAALGATLSASFFAVQYAVQRSEERQLDEAIRHDAHEQAVEIATRQPFEMPISRSGEESTDEIGKLPSFAELFVSGHVVDRTPGLRRDLPGIDPTARPVGIPFDVLVNGSDGRAVFAQLPNHPGVFLLVGSTRVELEKDVRFLREVMSIAALASLIVIVLVSYSIARGLTRDQAEIAATARRVAEGDFGARVALHSGDDDTTQLAADVDQMIERLETLVGSQQRFVANAAHELRSPLTALYGELQLALRRPRTTEEYKKAIDDAIGSAKRLIALAEDLLALARIGSDETPLEEDVDTRVVVEHAIEWAKNAAAARDVTLSIEGESAMIRGRAIDLERMVRNLVDNAVRHSPEHGEVKIELSSHAGGLVEIAVSDGGDGVPDSVRERIFEPFFRSSSTRAADESGSGLGLPIAREIARAHGGDVVLADDGVRGARFVATLRAS